MAPSYSKIQSNAAGLARNGLALDCNNGNTTEMENDKSGGVRRGTTGRRGPLKLIAASQNMRGLTTEVTEKKLKCKWAEKDCTLYADKKLG